MEGSEEERPLLARENKDEKPEDIAKSRKRYIKCRIFSGVAIACIVVIAAISGTAAFGVKFALYKNNDLECQNKIYSPPKNVESRSGLYSILDTVTSQELMCYAKPLLHCLSFNGYSSVEIYQTPCQDIEIQPFLAHYDFNDLPSAEGPRPLFDENFSPQNYFMKGIIEVQVVNATSNSQSWEADLCLFSDYYQYNSFLKAGTKWKNRRENAVCKTAALVDSNTDLMVSFNISEPMFAFVGMATTYPVQIDLINITAIGQDISGPGNSSTKLCQLDGETKMCNVSLPNEPELKNQSICIVAYEKGNPDGTYDYSNITIDIPNQVKHDNPYKRILTIYGSTSLAVIVILIVIPIMFTLIVRVIVGAIRAVRTKKSLNRRIQNRATIESNLAEKHSVQSDSLKVTCEPVEARHDVRSTDRQMLSIAGGDQLKRIIQQSQKHRTPPGEGRSADQNAGLDG